MMDLKNDTERIDELISGYFAQSLNNQELAELRQWLKANAENKSYFLKMQEIWFSAISANHAVRFNSEKAFQRFLSSKQFLNERKEGFVSKKSFRISNLSFVQVAASVAVLIGFLGLGYLIGNIKTETKLANVKIEAPLGSRTRLFLPDGTLVWLNAGSTIRYNQKFGENNRTVQMFGEGYFEVTKNKTLPFDVVTNGLKVRVLGTKFNFRNYADEDEASVTLIEGKVQLNDGVCTLKPNQQAVFDKNKSKIAVNQVKASYSSDWTRGLISFDEEKLANIVRELERVYNVNITIADDSLFNYRFYGNFTRTEQSIEDVLDVLASTNKLKYQQNGKNIVLRLK